MSKETKELHVSCDIGGDNSSGCGSSDGMTVYEDGSKHCFACNTSWFPPEMRGQTYQKDESTVLKPIDVPKLEYVDIKSRGISADTCRKYGIGIDPDTKKLWQLHYVNGMPIGAKLKWYGEDGKKRFSWVGDRSAVSMFGLHVSAHRYKLIITEGELDAAAAHEMTGYGAISLPFGAPSAADYVRKALPLIERAETVYVCVDMDDAGREANEVIMSLITPGKAHEVVLPQGYKDACEMSADGKGQEFKNALFASQPRIPSGIMSPDDVLKGALDFAYNTEKRVGISFGIPTLDRIFGGFRPAELSGWVADTGVGKVLHQDTPVFTSGGWKRHNQLRVGDDVLHPSGAFTQVVALSDYWTDRPTMDVVLSTGETINADVNHLWTVETTDRHRRRKTITTAELAETCKWTVKSGKHRRASRYRLVKTEPFLGQELPLPIDPYTFGCWLGDGTTNSGGFTSGVEDAEFYATQFPYELRSNKTHQHYHIIGMVQGMDKAMRRKEVPDAYLLSSYEQRLALLQGLVDTDGHVDSRGCVEFVQKREHLAQVVVFLARSLGSLVSQGVKVVDGQKYYRVWFRPDFVPARLPRKVANHKPGAQRKHIIVREVIKSDKTLEGRCIQVAAEDGLYCAGYTLAPTHNSTVCRQLMFNLAQQGHQVLYVPLEDVPEVSALQLAALKLGRTVLTSEGVTEDDREQLTQAIRWVTQHVTFLNHIGTLEVDTLTSTIEYAVRASGIKVVVLDHITALAEGSIESATSLADKAVAQLRVVVREHMLHGMIVSHIRKPSNVPKSGKVRPTLAGIKHASSIPQACNFVVGMYPPPESRDVLELFVLKGARSFQSETSETSVFLEYDRQTTHLAEPTHIDIDAYTVTPEENHDKEVDGLDGGQREDSSEESVREEGTGDDTISIEQF